MQVVNEMNDAQIRWRKDVAQASTPCRVLCDAAGLHGLSAQEQSCHRLVTKALEAIRSAPIDPSAIAVLEDSINHASVAASAMMVLQTPELLYLPDCINKQLTAQYGNVDHVLPRLCFVFSRYISTSYCDVCDSESEQPAQVSACPVAITHHKDAGCQILYVDHPVYCRRAFRIVQAT